MRLQGLLITAEYAIKILENDFFIYVKNKNLFFWVDDAEREDDKVIFYFEIAITPKGVQDKKIVYHKDENIIIIKDFLNKFQEERLKKYQSL